MASSGGSDFEVGDERARGAAMGGDHRVPLDRLVPRPHADGELRVAFAARRQEAPLVGLAPADDVLVARQHVVVGQSLPLAEGDLGQPVVGAIRGGREAERRAHQFHRLSRAHQRARHIVEVGGREAVALQQVAQDVAAADRLRAAFLVERDIVAALQPLLHVPVGEAVADVIEDGQDHHSLATTMSGASGCFMPTMW